MGRRTVDEEEVGEAYEKEIEEWQEKLKHSSDNSDSGYTQIVFDENILEQD